MRVFLQLSLAMSLILASCTAPGSNPSAEKFLGSSSCRECHERFYSLWAPSHHGLAMQPYTDQFAKKSLIPQSSEITIGDSAYCAFVEKGQGYVLESGPNGEARHPIKYALGGKNIYYFLTEIERGHLQVLPVAYDPRHSTWFDTTASMIRHFTEGTDEAIDWRERPLTFNTSCYNCHVSQLSTNYDLETDSYRTAWTEPGINCETCHGPGAEHVRVCREAGKGNVPADLRIIVTSSFNSEQTNDLCAPCHAKMYPQTDSFTPGDRFFDHFGLTTLEHSDFYPDGRDLGENYTFTLWRMNPCAKASELDCVHCHTSSGRNKHTGQKRDDACLPCHREYVENPEAHSHHTAASEGSRCVQCHMPETEFAKMKRHDHSMLPPTPASTVAFGSPNACNLCHTDQSPEWADGWVRQWYLRDYQEEVLARARLVDSARKGDWNLTTQILDYLERPDREEIVATSLIRLLQNCPDEQKWAVIRASLQDPSPLIRAAAVTSLADNLTPEILKSILTATEDEFRLVRIAAASSLSRIPIDSLQESDRRRMGRASEELLASLKARPDDWSGHYGLGNFYANQGRFQEALDEFSTATRIRPDMVPPLVNAAMIQARLNRPQKAEELLHRALKQNPGNAITNFNLGLLLAEKGDRSGAEKYLRAALKSEPTMAEAAYNLAVLLADHKLAEAIDWSRKAAELRPQNPRFSYTWGFYLSQDGKRQQACKVLEGLIERHPDYTGAYALLGDLYERQGRQRDAVRIYRKALESRQLPPQERLRFEHLIGQRKTSGR